MDIVAEKETANYLNSSSHERTLEHLFGLSILWFAERGRTSEVRNRKMDSFVSCSK